jgi:hypothetical protein
VKRFCTIPGVSNRNTLSLLPRILRVFGVMVSPMVIAVFSDLLCHPEIGLCSFDRHFRLKTTVITDRGKHTLHGVTITLYYPVFTM